MRKQWFKKAGITIICICLITGCSSKEKTRVPSSPTAVDKVLEQQTSSAAIEKNNAEENDKKGNNVKADENNYTEEYNKIEEDRKPADQINNETESDSQKSKPKESDEPQPEQEKPDEDGIDYDLTTMNSDMVYAIVYQMMVSPEDYIGKKIKVSGLYYANFYEPTDQFYHYIIIKDAMACCQQGIEFIWGDGSHVYPDEYPEDETEVEIVGIFETYTEDGDSNLYCHLTNAEMKVLED